jgi:tetratricopeptide (TPR) repeat protein
MDVGIKSVTVSQLVLILVCVFLSPVRHAVGQQASPAADQRLNAIALEQQGRNSEAEAAWQAVAAAEPNSAEPYAHLGFLEAKQEHYAQAIPHYRKAFTLDPAMPGLKMNLGLALFKAGELKEAVRIFNGLLEAQPTSSPQARRLQTLIGMADYGLEDYSAAVPLLKQATVDDPQNLPFRLILAHSCLAAKQYPCVLDVYHEILNLNAESAEADMLAGEALDEMQNHAGAIQQFRAAVKTNPKEPNVHFGLGYLLWTQLQYAEAAEEFQAELANVPDHVQALVYLADARIKLNQNEVALPLLLKAVRLEPNTEMAHLDLGIIYADMSRQTDAMRELKLAVTLNPNDLAAHWRIARLYTAMGRRAEAEAEFEKVKTLNKAPNESVSRKLNAPGMQSGSKGAISPTSN